MAKDFCAGEDRQRLHSQNLTGSLWALHVLKNTGKGTLPMGDEFLFRKQFQVGEIGRVKLFADKKWNNQKETRNFLFWTKRHSI